MDDRQKTLFSTILEEYIETAKPIGSNFLAEKSSFSLSSATIRLELAQLEKEGYLTHPHTSAGRIPTEKGYRYYIEKLLEEKPLSKTIQNRLEKDIKQGGQKETKLKSLAKDIAEISGEGVFVGFSCDDFYYTGLSNVFRKPEFSDFNLVLNLSAVVDKLDESLSKIFSEYEAGLQILIGQENPFGDNCATIFARRKNNQIFGLFGPMRMSYAKNKPLIEYTRELLTKI